MNNATITIRVRNDFYNIDVRDTSSSLEMAEQALAKLWKYYEKEVKRVKEELRDEHIYAEILKDQPIE